MLIGICGSLSAGKHTIQDYLVQEHGFQAIHLRDPNAEQLNGDHAQDGRASNTKQLADLQSLLDLVTRRSRERWVTTTIWNEQVLEALLHRPFFLLVTVDAPLMLRWSRFTSSFGNVNPNEEHPSIEKFLTANDADWFSSTLGLPMLADRAQLRLLNTPSSLPQLYEALKEVNLTNEQRLRPSWDQYFMQLASLAARRSNCMKRRVGCVLVRERRVISTGYNGTPRNIRNCNDGGCPRCNGASGVGVGLSTCLCIHAEENALLEAGKDRIREGATLYCDTCPCLTCSIKIAQVGISEVVYTQGYSMDKETAAVLQEAGVHLRKFSPPKSGLVDLDRLHKDG